MEERCFVVVGKNRWNLTQFEATATDRAKVGRWIFINNPADLTLENLSEIDPRYVFFLHWSEKIPGEIIEQFQCICFHMTDVPYGRGGSPLQNLIVRGHQDTVLTALRMTEEFDAGPVYMKRPMSLEGGSAEEIYCRASRLSLCIALEIAVGDPEPREQVGEAVVFRRRKPEESQLPANLESLDRIHDFIRMLDADGYPPAFLDLGKYRIEFSRSALYDGRVSADATIVERKENE